MQIGTKYEKKQKISVYLINKISSYINNRSVIITCRLGRYGVPQGLGLEPTLWNILYDAILTLVMGKNSKN